MNYGKMANEHKERPVAAMGYQVLIKGAKVKTGTNSEGKKWKNITFRCQVEDTNPAGNADSIDTELYKNPLPREDGGEQITLWPSLWLPTEDSEKWQIEQSAGELQKFARDFEVELEDAELSDKEFAEQFVDATGALKVYLRKKDKDDEDSPIVHAINGSMPVL